MVWLIPIGIVGAVVAIALLSGSKAAASPGSRSGGRKSEGDGPSGSDVPETPPKIVMPRPPPLERLGPGVKAPILDMQPTPTPGSLYRIQEGDTGSSIAVRAYGATKPTLVWMTKIAPHPANVLSPGMPWEQWFFPRWSAENKNTGSFTGRYATIYIPRLDEVQ